ncbi:hypothetical protein ACFX13_023090 [Malus domestica]
MENITGLDQNVINNGERNDQYVNKKTDEELFDEFKKARSIAEKRYITFREMMAHAMDASNRECLILSQMNIMLSSEVEKLLQKVEVH